MGFDPLVLNPGRLRILTTLAPQPQMEFVRLRQQTRLTDGNLCTHARRLASAGLITIDKSIRAGKCVTRLQLTTAGRAALEAHADHLLTALQTPNPAHASAPSDQPALVPEEFDDDTWVD